jgi:hypothetical protein
VISRHASTSFHMAKDENRPDTGRIMLALDLKNMLRDQYNFHRNKQFTFRRVE